MVAVPTYIKAFYQHLRYLQVLCENHDGVGSDTHFSYGSRGCPPIIPYSLFKDSSVGSDTHFLLGSIQCPPTIPSRIFKGSELSSSYFLRKNYHCTGSDTYTVYRCRGHLSVILCCGSTRCKSCTHP